MRSLILGSPVVVVVAMRHLSRHCGRRVSPEPSSEARPLPVVLVLDDTTVTRRTTSVAAGWGCTNVRPRFPVHLSIYATRGEQPLDT